MYLRWTDVDEIVEVLEENYADEEIPEHDLSHLKELVMALEGFEDHATEVSEAQLEIIIEHWIEYRMSCGGSFTSSRACVGASPAPRIQDPVMFWIPIFIGMTSYWVYITT